MDLLQEAAVEYQKLTVRPYQITFSNEQQIVLRFRTQNFRHLAGLGKFTDLHEIYTINDPNAIYTMALQGELTMLDLQRSVHYTPDAVERIRFLPCLHDLITQGSVVFGFDARKITAVTKLKSTILFFKEDGYNFYLTLGAAKGAGFYYPETFFNNFGGIYTKNQAIISIVETKPIV